MQEFLDLRKAQHHTKKGHNITSSLVVISFSDIDIVVSQVIIDENYFIWEQWVLVIALITMQQLLPLQVRKKGINENAS